jgi:hypothetical protein
MHVIRPFFGIIFCFQLVTTPLFALTNSQKVIFASAVAALAYKGHCIMRTQKVIEPARTDLNILLVTPENTHKNSSEGQRIATIIKKIEKGAIQEGDLLKINRVKEPGLCVISKNISTKNHSNDLFLYARGNSDRTFKALDDLMGSNGTPRVGGGILEAYKYIKERIINGTCVTFDFPDLRQTVSFGQENEIACLRTVYQEVVKNNPDKKVNYVAFCRGGTAGLDFATENPKNLATLTLESPLISFDVSTHFFQKSYLYSIPGSGAFMYNLIRYLFPAYKPEADNLLERVEKIPQDMPILIGHLRTDAVVSDSILHQLMQKLKDHKNVYLVVVNDTTKKLFHGQLNSAKVFSQACNAFYAIHDAPHNEQYAHEGMHVLEIARANAHRSPEEWIMVDHKP